MVLCSVCSRLDIRYLLEPSSEESYDIQLHRKTDYFWHRKGVFCFKHHDDIFQVQQAASGGCELCGAIWDSFGRVKDGKETFADLKLVLYAGDKSIEVNFDDSEEGLVKFYSFDLYAESGSDLSGDFLDKICPDPGCVESLNLASKWLRGCLAHHGRCNANSQELPTQTLCVGDDAQNPYLIEHAAGGSGQWVALSYCWGKEKRPWKLTRNKSHTLRQGLPLEQFDATIRDAILITRGLRIPYLWVDALCIFQDDDSRDWNCQSANMHKIYGGSTLTIAAVDSTSAVDGFLRARNPQYIAIEWRDALGGDPEHLPGMERQHVYLAPSWNPEKDKPNGPLTARGWTMQEGLLPNRVLYYTSHQMIWKCETCTNYERGLSRRPMDEILSDLENSGLGETWKADLYTDFKLHPRQIKMNSVTDRYRLWHDVIKEYSPRVFTHMKDRLIAIGGLAKIYGEDIGDDQYFAGLWKQDILRGLSWHTPGANLIPSKPSVDGSEGINQNPSWSWASTEPNAVVANAYSYDHISGIARVEEVDVSLTDPSNRFGAVTGGRVTVTGPVLDLGSLYSNQWACPETPMSALERLISETVTRQNPQGSEIGYSLPVPGRFAALALLQRFPSRGPNLCVLLLEKSSKHGVEDLPLYKRIGLMEVVTFSAKMLASPEMVRNLQDSKYSRRRNLNPRRCPRKSSGCLNKVVIEEYKKNPWPRRTIAIV